MLKYQKGYIFNGFTFVVNKEDVRNATDDMFVEATALLPDGWVSVKERFPEPFISVLVQMPDMAPFPTVREGFLTPVGWCVLACDHETERVTHWMPMPEPPKEADHETD